MSKHHKSGWCRDYTRIAIYARDHWCCVYCGKKFDRAFLSLDHIIPASKGGSNNPENLLTACRACNELKSDKPFETFVKNPRKRTELIMRAANVTLDRNAARAWLVANKTQSEECAA